MPAALILSSKVSPSSGEIDRGEAEEEARAERDRGCACLAPP